MGQVTMRMLAVRGAQVVIKARNAEVANKVKEAILQEADGHAHVHLLDLDLSSFQSVGKFVVSFNFKNLSRNLLM